MGEEKTCGRVLVIDDDEFISEMLITMLTMMGLRAEIVDNGQDALLRYAEAISENDPFNVAIVDLGIKATPESTAGTFGGLRVFQGLRDLDKNVQAIISTGSYLEFDWALYGFAANMPKPYSLTTLEATMAKFFPIKRVA